MWAGRLHATQAAPGSLGAGGGAGGASPRPGRPFQRRHLHPQARAAFAGCEAGNDVIRFFVLENYVPEMKKLIETTA